MSDWNTGFCDTNGIRIWYTRTGGDKPPLILLHGLAADGACWTPVARSLQDEYDVIMPDARGHGKSGAPGHGYLYDDHANDVIGLIDSLKLSSTVLLGHSMGGMTAAVTASRIPDRLRGLILDDPTFISPDFQREVYESDVAEQHRMLLTKSFEELVEDGRKRHPARSSETIELAARARLRTSVEAFEVLTPPNPDYKELLSKIYAPVLLVISDRGVVSPEAAREMQQINSKLRVEQIMGAGHGIHYDQPDRIAAVVKSFLSSIGESSAR